MDEIRNEPPKTPLWLRVVATLSYGLLFVTFAVVFVGGVYVLFFADPADVDPSSLNKNSPLLEKLIFLGFLLIVLVFGYYVNRRVLSAFLRPPRR